MQNICSFEAVILVCMFCYLLYIVVDANKSRSDQCISVQIYHTGAKQNSVCLKKLVIRRVDDQVSKK